MTGEIAIRGLSDLYIAVSAQDEMTIATAPERLDEIRAQLEQGSELYRTIFDQYFRLISQHVPALARQPRDATAPSAHRLSTPPVSRIVEPALRIAVSGIGRSGTTLIYQQLAKLLLLDGRKANFRYEPYLWNIRSAEAKGNPFDMSQLHHFGLMVHKTAPLFLEGPDPVHDPFIDHLFNERWDRDQSVAPDTYLTKVIRGSGRLRSYLTRFPDLKIVACLRNPVDTINSSLGMFSFFGEEFHADDRSRFRAEMAARGANVDHLATAARCIEWYGAWWQAFTEETLVTAAAFPDRVFLFCYETFQNAPQGLLEQLFDFVGVRNAGLYMGLSKPAGATIKSTSLTQHDMNKLGEQIAYYVTSVLEPQLGAELASERMDKVVSRYLSGQFSFPIAGSDLGRRAPIQLRGMMVNGETSAFLKLVKRSNPLVSLPDLIEKHSPDDAVRLRRPVEDPAAIKKSKTFGVVIPCHNNAATVSNAVLSCLNQSLPYDEIVVVNDKSNDDSAEILAELADLYSSVKVVNLPANLGPAAARDLGIRRLTTDFFTQLDSDDLFWPTKNACEAAAIAGDETLVAFSDILLLRPEKSFVQSTAVYSGKTGSEVFSTLMARTSQIPRDMTLSRKLYFEAGGYNMTMRLYEDWEFKLRVAAKSRAWIRAEGVAGTVYNRLSPGLSGVDDSLHARALVQIFLRALTYSDARPDDLLAAFDLAIGHFKTRHVATQARGALQEVLAKSSVDLRHFGDLSARRDVTSMDNAAFGRLIGTYAAGYQETKVTT